MTCCSEIVDSTFTWKIENFTQTNKNLQSPTFKVNDVLENTEWYLSLKCEDYLSIFLVRKTTVSESGIARIEFTISVVATDISSYLSKKITVKSFSTVGEGGFGFDQFVSLKKILDEKHVYLPQDSLTIQCYMVRKDHINSFEITYSDDISLRNYSHTKTLNKDLYSLYLDSKFCDVKIGTNGRVFSVHKTVLCARSPVFCAMFEGQTKEKNSGVVDISDIDSDTVSTMLTFMYFDSVEDMNQDQASKLYAAADKYGILSLKQKCSTSLKSLLSHTNVGDVYVLADMHQDVNLKSAVQEYVFIYAKRVFKSSEWEHFMELQPKLSAQLMHYLWIKQLED